MAIFAKPSRSLLFFAVMYADKSALQKALDALTKKFGPVKSESAEFDFTKFSTYYEPEMGKTLIKKYIVFKKPIDRAKLAAIRLYTQKLEDELSNGKGRTVNIDPGYITKDAIILASLKEKGHKIYLGKGVFADLQAFFGKTELRTFEYTFGDIKANAEFFLGVRRELIAEIVNNK